MQLDIDKSNQNQVYDVLNCLPEAVAIIQKNQVKFTNAAAARLRADAEGEHLAAILGINASYAMERLHKIQYENAETQVSEYELVNSNGKSIYIEATAYPMTYFGDSAALILVNDVTRKHNDTIKTRIEQHKRFQLGTVKALSIWINTLYCPAHHISGDFFFFNTLGTDELIGVIGDVSGKGTLSAMMISSFEVLFNEAIKGYPQHQPPDLKNIVAFINDKLMGYFPDKFIAALFFHIKPNSVELCSCGISKYITVSKEDELVKHAIRGPFLGMLKTEMDLFEYRHLNRSDLKKLILLSDGMDPFCENGTVDFSAYEDTSSVEMISAITNTVNDYKVKHHVLPDDLSLMSIDLDFNGILDKYVIYSITEMNRLARKVSSEYSDSDSFNIQLILSELVTNAYKYGNRQNSELPITVNIVHIDDRLIIKVTDMSIKPKILHIPDSLDDLMSESGRGLFILSNICSKLYYDSNNIIAEYQLIAP